MLQARGWISALLLLTTMLANRPAVAAANHPIRPPIVCPNRLEELMPLLLRDLPSYANRISQQAYQLDQSPDVPGYVVLAGEPNYDPLTLNPGEKLPAAESDTSQVFFTTLERQYVDGELIRLQHHHWLFITPTASRGWRLVLLYSAIGNYPAQQPVVSQPSSPPQDVSQGVIAQAIRQWLRDCEAGSVAGQK
ncbi:hypothetical protein IFO70_03650 [Phormidium tenue FACHB-886]|nr:hypothetical protein [Phormidium tenue FACHB-886]